MFLQRNHSNLVCSKENLCGGTCILLTVIFFVNSRNFLSYFSPRCNRDKQSAILFLEVSMYVSLNSQLIKPQTWCNSLRQACIVLFQDLPVFTASTVALLSQNSFSLLPAQWSAQTLTQTVTVRHSNSFMWAEVGINSLG